LYKLVIILRYLRKQRITFFPIAGVAIAVAALVGVMALADGLLAEYTARIRRLTPDIEVWFGGGIDGGSREGLADIVKRVESIDGVTAVSPVVECGAKCRFAIPVPGRARPIVQVRSLAVRGIDLERERSVSDLARCLKYGSRTLDINSTDPRPRIMVGARLGGTPAEGTNTDTDWGVLSRGASVMLTRMDDRMTCKTVSAVVEDVVKTGFYEDYYVMFARTDDVRRLGSFRPWVINGLRIRLKSNDAKTVASVSGHIKSAISDLIAPKRVGIQTWQEQVEKWTQGFDMLKRVMAIVLFFLFLISGFVVAAVLAMTAASKTRDIGILRAMGSSRGGIAAMYVAYGGIIGLVGAAIGIGIAAVVLQKVEWLEAAFHVATGWQRPAEMELGYIPWIMSWGVCLKACATAVAMSLAAGTLPALQAARMDPVKAVHRD